MTDPSPMTDPIYPHREVAAMLVYYAGFASEAEATNAIEDYVREHDGERTDSGLVLTDVSFKALADEAERGHDVRLDELPRIEGRSAVGNAVTVVTVDGLEIAMPPRIAELMYELAEEGGVAVPVLLRALHEKLRLDARPRSAEGS